MFFIIKTFFSFWACWQLIKIVVQKRKTSSNCKKRKLFPPESSQNVEIVSQKIPIDSRGNRQANWNSCNFFAQILRHIFPSWNFCYLPTFVIWPLCSIYCNLNWKKSKALLQTEQKKITNTVPLSHIFLLTHVMIIIIMYSVN